MLTILELSGFSDFLNISKQSAVSIDPYALYPFGIAEIVLSLYAFGPTIYADVAFNIFSIYKSLSSSCCILVFTTGALSSLPE